ncbi:MAG: glycosyltransferase [Elusimicrobiota bacterium]|nr:glycosyltransferase [Elusimicrobiota bacterium]
MNLKKHILLLTASYGTGHLTANRSIATALKNLYPDKITAETIDFLRIESFIHSGRIFEKLYNKLMELPVLWDIFFHLTDHKLAQLYFRNVLPIFYREVHKLFDSKKPDLCVTTHPYWNFLIDDYNRSVGCRGSNGESRKLRYICVITDALQIHHTWISPHCNYYLVTDDKTKEEIAQFGIEKDRIVVIGFPVDTNFAVPIDKSAFLTSLGLSDKLFTVLLVIGLGDTKRFLKIYDYLSSGKLNAKYQIIVITGKYKQIYNKLIGKSQPSEFLPFRISGRDEPDVVPIVRSEVHQPITKIIGWTDKMPEFIKSSDLIICKGGGAIVMESIAACKPVLIPVFTPGQERGNAKLLKNYGIGFVEKKFDKIIKLLELIITDEKLQNALRERLRKFCQIGQFYRAKSAEEIANFLFSFCSKERK